MATKAVKPKDEIELDPKGWERFEAAVGAAVRNGPRHRQTGHTGKRSSVRKTKPRRK